MPTYPKINIVKYNRDVFLPVGNINTFGWECDDHKVFTISEDKEDLFRIIEEKLYIVKYPTVGSHNIIIKMSDLFNRYDPVERNFTFNVSLCDNCQTGYICVELEDDDGGDGGGGDDDTGSDAGLSISVTLGTVERVLAGHDIGSKLRPLDPEVVNDENVSQSTISIEEDGSFKINSAESYLHLNDIDCIASGIDDKFIRDIELFTNPNGDPELFVTNFSSSCPFGTRDSSGNRIRLNGQDSDTIFTQDIKSVHRGELYNLKIGSGLYQEAPTSRTFGEVSLEYNLDIAHAVYDLNKFNNADYFKQNGFIPDENGIGAGGNLYYVDVNGAISHYTFAGSRLGPEFQPNAIWNNSSVIYRQIPLRLIVDSANSYENDDITDLVNRTSNITPQKQATAASLLCVWGYDSNGQSKSFPRYDNDQNILINNFSFLVNNANLMGHSVDEYRTSDNDAKSMLLDCARMQVVESSYTAPNENVSRFPSHSNLCWPSVRFFSPNASDPFIGSTPLGQETHWWQEKPNTVNPVSLHLLNTNYIGDQHALESVRHLGSYGAIVVFRHRFKIRGLGVSGKSIETPTITFHEMVDPRLGGSLKARKPYDCGTGGGNDDGIVPTPIRRDSETDVVNNLVPTTAAPATTTTTPVTSTAAPATTAAPTTSAPTTAAPTTAAPTTAAPTTAAPTTAAPTTAAPTTAAPTTAAPTTAAPTTAAPTTSPPYNPPY